MGAEVTEDTLARKWELERHQLRDHLPGGRIVGEEAAVPGGAGAREMVVDRVVRDGAGDAGPASRPPSQSPADDVDQRHSSQEQAQKKHQLEKEGGTGGSEQPWGWPGIPQECVLEVCDNRAHQGVCGPWSLGLRGGREETKQRFFGVPGAASPELLPS